MTDTSAAVQTTCRRSTYRPYGTAGRNAEYCCFSDLPRLEIYRKNRIKDNVKLEYALVTGKIVRYLELIQEVC